jgi:HEPN domain-containing protein
LAASSSPSAPKSVKDVIREGVRSQTAPFTLQDVREFIKERYPAMAGQIPSERYSKELYALRVAERLFEISSRGEKGGANVYKLRAA